MTTISNVSLDLNHHSVLATLRKKCYFNMFLTVLGFCGLFLLIALKSDFQRAIRLTSRPH